MDDDTDILYKLYAEDREFARHHETQRTNASSIIVAISAGLIAFISSKHHVDVSNVPACILVIGLGIFGIVFTEKHYERTRLHLYRAYEYYHALDARISTVQLDELRKRANKQSDDRFKLLSSIKLSILWMALHGIIAIIGIVLAFISIGIQIY